MPDVRNDGDDLTTREVDAMAGALGNHAGFLNNVGRRLVESGPFLEDISNKIGSRIGDIFTEELKKTEAQMEQALSEHELECSRARTVQEHIDDHVEVDVQEKARLGERIENASTNISTILNRIDTNKEEAENALADHKQYHAKNEHLWGMFTLLGRMARKHVAAFVLFLLTLALVMLLTGWGIKDTVKHMLQIEDKAKVTAPNK